MWIQLVQNRQKPMDGQLKVSRKSWVYKIPDDWLNLLPFLCICIIITSEVMKLQAKTLQKIFYIFVAFFTRESEATAENPFFGVWVHQKLLEHFPRLLLQFPNMGTIMSKLFYIGFLDSIHLKSWACQVQLQMPLKIWVALLSQCQKKVDISLLWKF